MDRARIAPNRIVTQNGPDRDRTLVNKSTYRTELDWAEVKEFQIGSGYIIKIRTALCRRVTIRPVQNGIVAFFITVSRCLDKFCTGRFSSRF